jgi:hypothetical protein
VVLLPAYIFTRTQDDLSYADALWHSWVTATTVGYGDVALTTQASRIWAGFQILLSVSWLAGLIARVQANRETRGFELQRYELACRQLDETLITGLDKDGNGVSRVEFVVGTLIALGGELCGEAIDWAADIQPLLDRFDALDADRSGYLTKQDLEVMAQETKRRKAALSRGRPKGKRAIPAANTSTATIKIAGPRLPIMAARRCQPRRALPRASRARHPRLSLGAFPRLALDAQRSCRRICGPRVARCTPPLRSDHPHLSSRPPSPHLALAHSLIASPLSAAAARAAAH